MTDILRKIFTDVTSGSIIAVITAIAVATVNNKFFIEQLNFKKDKEFKYERIPLIMSDLNDFIVKILAIDVYQDHDPKKVEKGQPYDISYNRTDDIHYADRKVEVLNQIEDAIRGFKREIMGKILISCDQECIDYFYKFNKVVDLISVDYTKHMHKKGPLLDDVFLRIIFMSVAFAVEGFDKLNMNFEKEKIKNQKFKKKKIEIKNIKKDEFEKILIDNKRMPKYIAAKQILIDNGIIEGENKEQNQKNKQDKDVIVLIDIKELKITNENSSNEINKDQD